MDDDQLSIFACSSEDVDESAGMREEREYQPPRNTQISTLPGETFEDLFGPAHEPPQDRIMLSPHRSQIGRFHKDGHDTERAAAIAVAPRSGTQRAHVLEALKVSEGGVTDYELWYVYGIGARPHVPATRREELIADGWPIVDSGERRKTDTGQSAIVWKLERTP